MAALAKVVCVPVRRNTAPAAPGCFTYHVIMARYVARHDQPPKNAFLH